MLRNHRLIKKKSELGNRSAILQNIFLIQNKFVKNKRLNYIFFGTTNNINSEIYGGMLFFNVIGFHAE